MENITLNFVGVGFPRCGTTWLMKNLSEHPSIEIPKKELNYFNEEFHSSGNKYLQKYFNIESSAIKGEFTPDYIYDERAIENLISEFPDVKIIVVLRNPVERALSHYHLARFAGGKENRKTFFCALNGPLRKDYIDKSYYSHYISLLLQHVNREQVYFMIYENMKEHPLRETNKLLSFLGIDHFKQLPQLSSENASSSFNWEYKPILSYYKRFNNFMGRILGESVLSKKIKSFFRPFFRKMNQVAENKLKKERKQGNVVLGEKDKKYVYQHYFKGDIEKLEDLIDEDLSFWKYA